MLKAHHTLKTLSAEPCGCRGCCLSAYCVDFSVYIPPLQYSGLLSFPSKQQFAAKIGRRGRTGSQYLLLRHVKEERDFTMTSMLNFASVTALKEGL